MRKRIECKKKSSRKKQHTPWQEKLKTATTILSFLYTVYRIVKEILD